jgi:hypothetical protein
LADKPWSVAFVGAGESTEENVKHLLDDWMHGNREYNPPVIPNKIPRAQTGLKRVWDWLDTEFGSENVDKLDATTIVTGLLGPRDDGKAESFLVYIPAGEDDPYLPYVKHALDEGIPVLDLTAGLYPFELAKTEPEADPDPEPEDEKPAPRRRRGTPRTPDAGRQSADGDPEGYGDPVAPNQALESDPPWDTDDETTPAVPEPSRSETSQPATASAGGITVNLSQQTLDLLMATFTSLGQDVAAAVAAGLPGAPKPKTYPYWVDEDGNYRKRGQGRPRKGETEANLTAAEIEELGL